MLHFEPNVIAQGKNNRAKLLVNAIPTIFHEVSAKQDQVNSITPNLTNDSSLDLGCDNNTSQDNLTLQTRLDFEVKLEGLNNKLKQSQDRYKQLSKEFKELQKQVSTIEQLKIENENLQKQLRAKNSITVPKVVSHILITTIF